MSFNQHEISNITKLLDTNYPINAGKHIDLLRSLRSYNLNRQFLLYQYNIGMLYDFPYTVCYSPVLIKLIELLLRYYNEDKMPIVKLDSASKMKYTMPPYLTFGITSAHDSAYIRSTLKYIEALPLDCIINTEDEDSENITYNYKADYAICIVDYNRLTMQPKMVVLKFIRNGCWLYAANTKLFIPAQAYNMPIIQRLFSTIYYMQYKQDKYITVEGVKNDNL